RAKIREKLMRSAAVTGEHAQLERFVDFVILDELLHETRGSAGVTELVDLVVDADPAAPKEPPRNAKRTPGRYPSLGWLGVTAASVMLTLVIWSQWIAPAMAAPSDVLHAAIEVHRQDLERVYLVERQHANRRDTWSKDDREVRVITRGNQFWVRADRGDQRWAWGREDDGDVWLVLNPGAAMRIDRQEIGQPVQDFAELYSLQLESLLDHILRDCELSFVSSDGLTHVIAAKARDRTRAFPAMIEGEIEVDRETKAVRRLTIVRSRWRRARRVTFTLIDTRPADPSLFNPEGHLEPKARVFEGEDTRQLRRQALVRRFGNYAADWIVDPSEPSK
ncbi:MAG: hypothetical protein AAFN70_17155, partial [Planctomycetota bacterium]